MSDTPDTNPPVPAPAPAPPPAPKKPPTVTTSNRIGLAIQIGASVAVALGVLGFLIWSGSHPGGENEDKRPRPPEPTVEVIGTKLLKVKPGTPLDDKLDKDARVKAVEDLPAPIIPVTGTVLASLTPGKDEAQDKWQFASPDLTSAFTDWNKAVIDVQFQKNQLDLIRALADYRVEAQKEVVSRMEKLVKVGTHTEKDMVAERVNLKQFEIQGKKEIHEGENAVKVAQKTEAALARQLQQAGLEPTMLHSAAAEGKVVVAEVPEAAINRVKLGMKCQVRFVALPGKVFDGKVSAISPVIQKDKRILNVQFVVADPDRVVIPGMFGEIGLGTGGRHALLMPVDGVLHIGDRDYALRKGQQPDTWNVVEVQLGELHGKDIEVLAGLQGGDTVLGKGAILLKPVVIRVLASGE